MAIDADAALRATCAGAVLQGLLALVKQELATKPDEAVRAALSDVATGALVLSFNLSMAGADAALIAMLLTPDGEPVAELLNISIQPAAAAPGVSVH
jgi:hypothetical protein